MNKPNTDAANTGDNHRTPRTDAIFEKSPISSFWWPDFARQLERELAVARGATVIDGEKRMRCSQDVAFSIQAMKERYETDTDQLRAKVADRGGHHFQQPAGKRALLDQVGPGIGGWLGCSHTAFPPCR